MVPKPAYLRPDALAAMALLAFSIVLWVGAGSLPQSRLGGGVGADGLPKVLAGLLAILSVVLLVQTLVVKPAPAAEPKDGTWSDHLRAAGIFGIGALVFLALPVLGYAVTVALLLIAMALFHHRRLSARLVFFCAIAAGAFYLLFVQLLSVRMPVGLWPKLLPF